MEETKNYFASLWLLIRMLSTMEETKNYFASFSPPPVVNELCRPIRTERTVYNVTYEKTMRTMVPSAHARPPCHSFTSPWASDPSSMKNQPSLPLCRPGLNGPSVSSPLKECLPDLSME